MSVSSVTSSVGAYTNASVQTNQSQQEKQVEPREPSPAERVEFKEEPPKPVTNALGQTTGSLINITA